MPTTHTVAQGETLTRIARKYKYGSWQALYNHPDNAEFKKLRTNPNLIFPGDQIIIPDIEPKLMNVGTAKQHVFCLKREKEFYRVQLKNALGDPLKAHKVTLLIEGGEVPATLSDDGVLETELVKGTESGGEIQIYLIPESEEPDYVFEIQLGSLDPIETLSGVQSRCNALGYDCGVADGIMGAKTRAGVQAFQAAHGLDVDGVPGPKTKAKLEEIYGC